MTDYSTQWDKLENNKAYLDIADIVIQDRNRLIKIMKSFFKYYFPDNAKIKILDLGCGDGILSKSLYLYNSNIDILATDGSAEMLEKAKMNLKDIPSVRFKQITFEEIIDNKLEENTFDFIVSSFAIHHLVLKDKKWFFKKLYELLQAGGYFMNIDTCLSINSEITAWYYRLWKEWIIEFQKKCGITDKDYSDIPAGVPSRPENHYDRLDEQLLFLNELGYKDVECHYKYGIFCIYGAKK